jgi:hypothetical protein
MVMVACKREKPAFLGPAYIAAPAGFAVTSFTATPITVNFSSNTATSNTTQVSFNATFTSSVSWTLTITGQQSGAVCVLKGISDGLTNIAWKGTNDGLTFFRKGETAIATLSFYGTSLAPTTTVTITDVRKYSSYGTFPLAGDFEDTSKVLPRHTHSGDIYSPYWASFNFPTAIANESQGIDSMAIDYNGNPVPSVQGKKYYYIKGLGAQAQFVSGLQYFGALLPKLPATPDNIWVNMYIYGTGDANAAVDLEYQEDDLHSSPGYVSSADDAWVAHLVLNHTGWKLFSIKYSDLVVSSNVGFGDKGNHIQEPNRMVSFDLVLLKKSNPNTPVEVYFDFPIFTVGGPFDPSK